MTSTLFDFWGKAERSGPGWHPAVCHMLDVGIVVREILSLQPLAFRQRLTSLFDPDEAKALNVLAFVAALHDIGKISPGFQLKREDLCAHLKERGFTFPSTSESKHGRIVLDALTGILEEKYCCGRYDADALARILAAHHGVFEECRDVEAGDRIWQEAREEAVAFLARIFGVTSLASLRLESVPELFLLAGLISVADWIASDEETFGYLNSAPADIETYILERTGIARTLLERLSMGTTVDAEKPFSELFDFGTPNSCQQATLDVLSRLTHPMLIVVETPMGSGKTEAAQAAYARLAVRDGLRGMYCALPTQATGNAMFDRMRRFLARLHDEKAVELHLLHANAGMHPEYDKLKIKSGVETSDTVIASSWFTQKKRGLLAAYGTGTIDQALLSILRVRHFFVRLFGLGGKMIILDEVHAYDAYMSEEIYNLIGWASRCGSSIVLLSATLPANKRKKLVTAFRPDVHLPDGLTYPCVFGVDLQGPPVYEPVVMTPSTLEISPVLAEKSEKVRKMADMVMDIVANDGCLACIVNTVTEAQELYDLLKDRLPEDELILFHSRFTIERRLEIEQAIVSKYGKDGKRPQRGVVVASPVLQESLDVCFDAMLSELAPFDLLLQRAGRLHRHKNERPPHLQARRLYVFLPDLNTVKPDFGWSGLIYFPDLLYRSGTLFMKDGKYYSLPVEIPNGVSALIEAVYDGEDLKGVDDEREKWLEKRTEERDGAEYASKFHARTAAIMSVHEKGNDPDYLGGLQNGSDDETMPSTRIGRQRITLIILEQGEDISIPNRAAERRLYMQSISTDNVRLVKHFADISGPVEWSESPLLRYCHPVFFAGGIASEGEFMLAYDRIRGLSMLRKGGNE
ncbi:MAG: CRISPR-associated helicase Cas3' [Desulfuromonadaceae bacterium]|nr:CRISPR-associated helicase Cas3' [Desulfuromonadaceae bacterium]MDD5104642.1 CRISPR-associated helicase Cas3' [Desulfuromonadaceae bacterium]